VAHTLCRLDVLPVTQSIISIKALKETYSTDPNQWNMYLAATWVGWTGRTHCLQKKQLTTLMAAV